MSWIGGTIILEDASKKEIGRAERAITSAVRHNADLEEFPNMKCRLQIVVKNNKIFDSFEAAENFSNEHYNEWARKYNLCVPFRDTAEAKITKKMEDIIKRMDETLEKRERYINTHHVRDFKAAYIGCQTCGSKINKEYLRGDQCAVCHSELRSETVIKTIKSYDRKIKDLERRLKEEKSKQKVPVKYAVFYCEYIG